MCTLTIVRGTPDAGAGFRVLFSRDEQRSRPDALPPRLVRVGAFDAIMPIDAGAGGTWLGVNARGVVAALLNRTDPAASAGRGTDGVSPPQAWVGSWAGRTSRGHIVPALLESASLAEAHARASLIDPAEFAPFRVVVVTLAGRFEATSDGQRLEVGPVAGHTPAAMWTSSGLGDHVVRPARDEAFSRWRNAPTFAAQEAFHRLTQPDAGHLGVLMARADARTVSLTRVDVSPSRAELAYWPVDEAVGPRGPGHRLELALVHERVEAA